jgi:hypothetical protein
MGRYFMSKFIIIILITVIRTLGTNNEDDFYSTITPMEALDLVKETYATNFTKVSVEDGLGLYYYKLDKGEYYLVYEDTNDTTGNHLIHLYEFVIDDKDSQIGHTVTYGWYWVDQYSGDIFTLSDNE